MSTVYLTATHSSSASGSGSSSASGTASSSATVTSSSSSTGTASSSATGAAPSPPGCAPSSGGYAWLPYHSLDGRVLGVAAAAGDAEGCRAACCATPGCDGFTLQVLPAPVRGTCALLGNLTQLVPAVTFGAGLLRGAPRVPGGATR